MAAVPVSIMHSGAGMPQMMLPACSMMSMNVPMTSATMTMANFQPQLQNAETYLNNTEAMSPSRSLSSASPPIPANIQSPTPEEERNPEYLKELQAEYLRQELAPDEEEKATGKPTTHYSGMKYESRTW